MENIDFATLFQGFGTMMESGWLLSSAIPFSLSLILTSINIFTYNIYPHRVYCKYFFGQLLIYFLIKKHIHQVYFLTDVS